MSELDSRLVARVHEAGHAIVALCLGLEVARVIAKDIGQATTSVAWPTQVLALKRAAYYLAGKAAEEAILGQADGRTGVQDSEAVASCGLTATELDEAKRLVACCIDRNRSALTNLAGRLAQIPPSVYQAELVLLKVVEYCTAEKGG